MAPTEQSSGRTGAARYALYGGLILAAVLAVVLLLSASAVRAVLDLRPGLLGLSGVTAVLLGVGFRAAGSMAARGASLVALLVSGGTITVMIYDLTLTHRTEEVSFTNGDVTLQGTLYLPRSEGPHPALILIHGSGRQTRRDTAFYARAYARRGVAALAYDKRGSGASSGDVGRATYEQLAADAASGIHTLRARPDIDARRVGIWGVSEGEWVGALAAMETDPAFLVLVSPSAMTPSRQVQYETGANVRRAGFSEEAARLAAELYGQLAEFQRSGANRDELNRQLQKASREPWFAAARYLEESVPEYEKVVALSWFPTWRARMDFDALPLLAQIRCPVLAQAGGNDPKNDGAAALRRIQDALAGGGNTSFTGALYPQAGHNIIEWRLPGGLPPPWFASGYVETQLDWVERQVSAR